MLANVEERLKGPLWFFFDTLRFFAESPFDFLQNKNSVLRVKRTPLDYSVSCNLMKIFLILKIFSKETFFIVSSFSRFSVKVNPFRSPKLTSLNFLWCHGTDENFLNDYGESVFLFHFVKGFGPSLCANFRLEKSIVRLKGSPSGFFNTIRLLRRKKIRKDSFRNWVF